MYIIYMQWILKAAYSYILVSTILVCTGALHYVPYSSLLISNTLCFSWILDFCECIMFLNRTSAIKKYYVRLGSSSSVLVAHDCNPAIGGQGQSGCMRPVCRGSSSELWTNVRTMLQDAARLSWLGLEPGNRSCLAGQCWLASANGVGAGSSPGEGRQAVQTIVLHTTCSSSSS